MFHQIILFFIRSVGPIVFFRKYLGFEYQHYNKHNFYDDTRASCCPLIIISLKHIIIYYSRKYSIILKLIVKIYIRNV